MTVGCFGNSDIDRWMSRNLDRYLDDDSDESRKLLFKVFKHRKLIKEFWKEVLIDDSCYHDMKAELIDIHTKELKKYLKHSTSGQSLFHRPRKGPHTYYNPETCLNYCGVIDEYKQQEILERWANIPKEFYMVNGTFNLLRIGHYSVVCNDMHIVRRLF